VSDLLNEKTPIRARHIGPGQGQAVEVKAGQFLQIETLQGKQVADFIAFALGDTEEHLSTSVTMGTNANVVPKLGMTLYSNRRQPMFEIVEDTVGRHDMLYACCDPVRYEMLDAPGHANCREALTDALSSYGVGYDRIPTPINWFMNVSIQQRGELDIREPLAEAGDYVLLRALKDVVAAVSACPQDLTATNGFKPTDLRIRVYRDAPLPGAKAKAPAAIAAEEATGIKADAGERGDAAARRAERRAQRRAAAAEATGAEQAAEPEAAPTAQPAVATGRPARLAETPEAVVVRVES
jgi:uncharacterized protein YcgI (DUF1989 family)